ncbi:MAG: DegT/DnrJ/EryC1/StrS family aminotransferase [Flavobacteriaceae bacterium]|jgi:perosamine synthetase|nr:DegT/DnrJ/EryC1/StrS family aminotransferase [Flavobacteriaceae bacterium]
MIKKFLSLNKSVDTKLALEGGNPIRNKKWKDNFTTGRSEKRALSRVIDSGYLSLFEGSHTPDHPFSFKGGPFVQKLESMWSEYYDCKHSISVNSATSGLYMAIAALGVGYGDEVIVSPYTMTACAIAPLIYGAIPVFADVEVETGSIDPESFKNLITKRTKAIIVVHQFGIPANMKAILKIANENNIKVIEDCAQAHGAKYNDKHVGTIGDIGVFSFNVNKTIQTGEGGICITNDDELAYRLQLVRNHGEAVVGPAKYDNITNIAGYNYRLTELQAAVGIEQLNKLDTLNNKRIELVNYLSDKLSKYNFLITPVGRENCHSTYYLYPLRFIKEKAKIDREKFIKYVNAEGIKFYQGYVKPLYNQPVYQKKHLFKNGYPFSAPENKDCLMNYGQGTSPNAELLHFHQMIINEHIRLPHKKSDMNDIILAVEKVVRNLIN